MGYNAIYYLVKMPHKGRKADLAEACTALGLEVFEEQSQYAVRYFGTVVARIVDDTLMLDTASISDLEENMSAITHEQGEAFNRILATIERPKIAIHEAGHVLAALELGLDFCYVRIGEQSEVQLCSDCDADNVDYKNNSRVEDFQTYFAAGAAAEQFINGSYVNHGVVGDFNIINEMEILKIDAAIGNAPNHIDVVEKYVSRAQELLRKQDIEAIAERLFKAGFLNRVEVQETLEKSE